METLALTTKYLEKSLVLAKNLLMKGHKKEAVKLFSKGVLKADKRLYVKERIVDLCMEHGEYTYAKQLLESILNEFPSKYELVLKAGYVYQELCEEDKALEHFYKVDKYQNNRVEAKLQIAKILLEKGQIYKADEYVTRILQKEPENPEALALREKV